MANRGGDAVIERGAIVIRFPLDALQSAMDGAWGMNVLNSRQKVVNEREYANELVRLLNREDEQGTTQVHKLMDWAFNESLEQGCEGIEDHPEQEK
jgi:hypothetical protein